MRIVGPGRRQRSLRTAVVTWFLIPTVIILAVVGLFAFYTYQRVTEELVIERNQALARLLASQVALDLAAYANQLNALAATVSIYPSRSDPLTGKVIITLAADRLWDFDAGVVIVDETGTVIAADRRRLDAIGQNWSGRAYFGLARAAALAASGGTAALPQPVYSDIVPDGPQGGDAIVVAVPARGVGGEFLGLSAGLFRVDSGMEARNSAFYAAVLEKLQQAGSDIVFLLDGNGRAIYHSVAEQIGADLAGEEVVQRALAVRSGGMRTHISDGREIVASFAEVPSTNWVIVTEQDWDTVIGTSAAYGRLLLGLLALGVAVPALVIALGARRITHPIAQLTAAVQDVAGGRFGRVSVAETVPDTADGGAAAGDELEELARQFNRMSRELEESYATLERRVADRTRELATLNSIAALVSRSLDLHEILRDALIKTVEAMGMEAGAAQLLDEDGRWLELVAHDGLSPETIRLLTRMPPDQGVAGVAARTSYPAVMLISGYPEGTLRAHLEREGWLMTVGVPLIAKGKVSGVLTLLSRAVRRLKLEELSLLAAIGQQTGVAVENARLYQRAEETAAMTERNRLARDLHDAVTQTLFSASMIADVLPRLWERNPEEGRRRLEELRQLTRGALAEMRTLLVELRPAALEEAPLEDLLRQLTEAITGRARLPVTLEIEGRCALPTDVKVGFYRIAQEALNNIFKHAAAQRASVSLRCTAHDHGLGAAELRIADDGRGFDPATVGANHLGLSIMRERAEAIGAHLTLSSAAGKGTEVIVTWAASQGGRPE